jgi:hypothetical protein
MPQPAQHQPVPQQSATSRPDQPQPNTNDPDRLEEAAAMTRLAEAGARVLRRLNHPHARKSSTSKPRAGSGIFSVRQAKNYLRSTRPPKFLNPKRSLERHRRKCAICHHPEREMIEELFVHWHSPRDIADQFDDYDTINWVSIYRHAYALGLDAIRRRNLGFVFENILDNAADATPTAAGVVAAARALGCVGEDGRWVEPEKRITMTTIVRKEDPDSATTSTDADSVQSSADSAVAAPSQQSPVRARFQPCRNQSHINTALAADGLSENVLSPSTVRAGSREIRLPLNSHRTKDKPISNR